MDPDLVDRAPKDDDSTRRWTTTAQGHGRRQHKDVNNVSMDECWTLGNLHRRLSPGLMSEGTDGSWHSHKQQLICGPCFLRSSADSRPAPSGSGARPTSQSGRADQSKASRLPPGEAAQSSVPGCGWATVGRTEVPAGTPLCPSWACCSLGICPVPRVLTTLLTAVRGDLLFATVCQPTAIIIHHGTTSTKCPLARSPRELSSPVCHSNALVPLGPAQAGCRPVCCEASTALALAQG